MPNLPDRIEALCQLARERDAAEWREFFAKLERNEMKGDFHERIQRECEKFDRVLLYEQGEPQCCDGTE